MSYLKLLLCGALLSLSCRHCPLEYLYSETALIPIRIDWSMSGGDVRSIHPFLLNGRSYHQNGKDGTERNVSKFDITEQVVVSTVQPVVLYNAQLEYLRLGLRPTNVTPRTYDTRSYGFAVRCVSSV